MDYEMKHVTTLLLLSCTPLQICAEVLTERASVNIDEFHTVLGQQLETTCSGQGFLASFAAKFSGESKNLRSNQLQCISALTVSAPKQAYEFTDDQYSTAIPDLEFRQTTSDIQIKLRESELKFLPSSVNNAATSYEVTKPEESTGRSKIRVVPGFINIGK